MTRRAGIVGVRTMPPLRIAFSDWAGATHATMERMLRLLGERRPAVRADFDEADLLI